MVRSIPVAHCAVFATVPYKDTILSAGYYQLLVAFLYAFYSFSVLYIHSSCWAHVEPALLVGDSRWLDHLDLQLGLVGSLFIGSGTGRLGYRSKDLS